MEDVADLIEQRRVQMEAEDGQPQDEDLQDIKHIGDIVPDALRRHRINVDADGNPIDD